MGKIKKILENELLGGTQNTDVYPITSTQAVYNENNEKLSDILVEHIKRIQGTSKDSDAAKDPFKFLGTFTRVTDGEFLNALNAMHGTDADVYDGYWRALIGASPVEIYNFAIYYKDDRWIQVLKSPYKWGDGDFDIINDTRYRTIYRIHENGAWGEWKDTEEELKKSISDETTRAKDAEQKLKDEIDNHLSKNVAWNSSSNLNDFTTAGVYNIQGERTMNKEFDNLPIDNSGGGHTISARLEVLDSSIDRATNSDDKCITQKLTLSNRVGGDGNVYIRTGRGRTYDSITWEKWGTLQTNINVGQVGSLDEFVDNGIYSGVWTDGSSFAQTFVMVVINDYAIAGANKTIVQYKYAYDTLKGNGEPTYNTRSLHNGEWSDWEDVHDDDLNVLKSELLNAIKEETLRAKKEEFGIDYKSEDIIDSIGARIISKKHIIHREVGKPYTQLVYIGNLPAQQYKSRFFLYDLINDDVTINLCNKYGDVIVNLGTILSDEAEIEVTFNIENSFDAWLSVNLPIAQKGYSVDLYCTLIPKNTILDIINDETTRAKNAESVNSIAIGEEEFRAIQAENTLQKNIDNTNNIVGIEEKESLTVEIGAVLEDGSTYLTNNSAYTNAFEGGDIAVTNDGYLIYDARKVSADGVAEMVLVKSKRLRTEKGYTYQLNISKDNNAQFSENELEGIVGLYNYEGGDTSELEQKIEDAIRPVDENLNIVDSYVKGLAEKVKPSVNANTLEFEFDEEKVHLIFSDIDEDNEESYDVLLPTATTMGAGVMSAEDKKVLENLYEEAVKFDTLEVEELGDGIGINFDTFNGHGSSIEIPFVTEEKAGVMTSEDKRTLKEVSNRVDTDDNFSDFRADIDVNATNIATLRDTTGNSIVDIDISPNKLDVELDLNLFNDKTEHRAIPTATTETAGVMSAEDKKTLDAVPENIAKEKTAIVNGDTIAGLAREVYSRTGKVDTATFLKRTTAGGTTISDGVASIKEIGGNIVKNLAGNYKTAPDVVLETDDNGVNTLLPNNSGTLWMSFRDVESKTTIKDHIYYNTCVVKSDEPDNLVFGATNGNFGYIAMQSTVLKTTAWQRLSYVRKSTASSAIFHQILGIKGTATYPLYAKDFLVIDLTEMFGAGKEPTKEECDRLFGNMDALPQGLTIAQPTGLKSIGYNQWNPVNVLRNKSIVENSIEDDVENSHIAVVECLPCKIGEGENNGYVVGYGEGELWDEDGIEVYFSPLNPMDYIDQDVNLYMHKLEQDATYGTYVPQCKGYLLVVTPTTDKLCVNFHWSGDRSKLDYEEYTESNVALPEIPQMSEWGLAGIQTSGTLACDTIDLERGVYVKRIQRIEMSEKKWYNQSTSRFYCDLGSSFESAQANIIVSNAYTSARFYASSQEDMTIASTGRYIYIKDSRYATADELRASFTNEYIFVSLATPEEYPIVTKTAPNYIGSDYGVEEFTGSKVPLNANILFYMRSLVGETRNFLDRLYDNTDKTDAKEVADYITNGIEGNKELATNAPNLALRALFIAAGAEYNDTDQIIQKTAPWETEEKWRLEDDGTYTYWEEPAIVEHLPGHYYLNGLGDITEEEMMTIYIETFPLSKIPNWINALRGAKSRTNIFPNRLYASQIVKDISYSFYGYTTDVICLNAGNYNISTTLDKQVSHTFYECSVKRVIGVIDFVNTQASAYGERCSKLIDFKMKNIKLGNHKTFGLSPNISKRSVLYLIQNASPTTAITVTLHPDAYARIANQPDILEALEAQPLITLVSA